MLSLNAFLTFLSDKNTGLSEKQLKKASQFAEILHRENEKQNLTRIVGVDGFYEGHLFDVIELMKLKGLGKQVMDIGSGSGVPGLLAAAIDEEESREWQLVESEGMKAEYLADSAAEMGLKRVTVAADRVENVIRDLQPDTIIARAVGSVEKIAAWTFECSTWNNLILFKSKGWEDEWKEAQLSRFGKKLTITHTHEYSIADKYRVLVTLKRK